MSSQIIKPAYNSQTLSIHKSNFLNCLKSNYFDQIKFTSLIYLINLIKYKCLVTHLTYLSCLAYGLLVTDDGTTALPPTMFADSNTY